MNISPISVNNTSPVFGALKYQNGMQTSGILSSEMKDILARYNSDIKKMENIDIVVSDEGNISLGVKIPRFLNEKYKRFFKDKKFDKVYNDEEGAFVLSKGTCVNKLIQDKVPGIYNVFFSIPDTDEWRPSYPIRTLEIAKSIDAIMLNIDDAENNYGLNCIEVLKDIDNLREAQERMQKEQARQKIVNQIKSVYTSEDEFKNFNDQDLAILLEKKDEVVDIKNYGIVMKNDDHSWYDVLIHDKNGYLDDIFSDFYAENNWKLERISGGFNLHPVSQDYPDYSLVDKGDGKYHVYVDFYEGGSNLGSFGGDHFENLIRLMQKLDIVAKSIAQG